MAGHQGFEMKRVSIGDRYVGEGAPVFVIAEAGVNHNGDVGVATRLIEVAAQAGADAVKFQTFKAERLATAAAPKAAYQLLTTDGAESQRDMLRRLELSAEAHRELRDYCEGRGLLFLSTPFDRESVDLLDALQVPAFKIASGEVTNWPLLAHIARKGRPVLLSTGMAYLREVGKAVSVMRDAGCAELILLHCISQYPAHPADANLRAMQTMAEAFQVPVGYSDHTPGIEVALAAVAMGACVIEKHFTLDKNLPGPDHRASLAPDELRALVAGVRLVESARGHGRKAPAASEMENRTLVRRSLAAAVDIPEGTTLQPGMLQALRPATGISPVLMDAVVGRTVKRSLPAGELIAWNDLT